MHFSIHYCNITQNAMLGKYWCFFFVLEWARVLWANLSAQGARVRERWLTRPLAPCSQLKAHSREREIGSQDCYSNMVEHCLTMFCRETLEYGTFCREALKYDTFCRKNIDSALWAKKWQICGASRLHILCHSAHWAFLVTQVYTTLYVMNNGLCSDLKKCDAIQP